MLNLTVLVTNNQLSELILLWAGFTLVSLLAIIMLTLAFIPGAWQRRLGVYIINRDSYWPDVPADSLFARSMFLGLGTCAFAGALFMLFTMLI